MNEVLEHTEKMIKLIEDVMNKYNVSFKEALEIVQMGYQLTVIKKICDEN